mmetsp:Transcript_384/g.1271  ORF Transcript_384/g.1271 Transcript_384/m.1271 type:complete len:202 (+) Transcript_384:1117-1722(+)
MERIQRHQDPLGGGRQPQRQAERPRVPPLPAEGAGEGAGEDREGARRPHNGQARPGARERLRARLPLAGLRARHGGHTVRGGRGRGPPRGRLGPGGPLGDHDGLPLARGLQWLRRGVHPDGLREMRPRQQRICYLARHRQDLARCGIAEVLRGAAGPAQQDRHHQRGAAGLPGHAEVRPHVPGAGEFRSAGGLCIEGQRER